MVRKAVGQASLVEALLPAAFGSNQRLGRIAARVDWLILPDFTDKGFSSFSVRPVRA